MPFELTAGESILWEGSLLPPRRAKITLACFLGTFAFIQLLVLSGAPFQNQIGIDVFIGMLIILNLIVYVGVGRIRFYVTNRRIVRSTNWLVLKREFQLPLQSLVEIRATCVREKPNVGYVKFTGSEGYVTFGPFRGDPEKVREITLGARSTTTGFAAETIVLTKGDLLGSARKLIISGIMLILVGAVVWGLGTFVLGEIVIAAILGTLLLLGGIVLLFTGVDFRRPGRK